jgi:hypothetical protein
MREHCMAKSIQLVMIAMVVMAASLGGQTKPKPTPKPILTPKPAPKPNFTGRWAVVSPAADAGKEQLVTQDDKTLTTERAAKGSTHKMVYQLDGVERRQAIPLHNEITMLTRSSWKGDHIVIAINTSYDNGMRTQLTETWSIDAKGQLVIDSTQTGGPNGHPGPPDTTKTIYVKKK